MALHMSEVQLDSDTAYDLWVRGELDDYIHAPEGSRVEIIGGEIVVSPAPVLTHNYLAQEVADAIAVARHVRSDFSWNAVGNTGLSIVGIRDGYIPDLVVIESEVLRAALAAKVRTLVTDQIEMAVEVTSPSNGKDDREPNDRQQKRKKQTKWQVYAQFEIPYYLLSDRDPKVARTTLYSIPDSSTRSYLHEESWDFGQTIHLPDPFALDLATANWEPWD